MSSYEDLIDKICKDNCYILDFQATQTVRNLANSLIDVRDGNTDNFDKILECLKLIHEEITTEINLLNKNDSDYIIHLDYFEWIKNGIIASINRLNNVQIDVANLSINQIEDV